MLRRLLLVVPAAVLGLPLVEAPAVAVGAEVVEADPVGSDEDAPPVGIAVEVVADEPSAVDDEFTTLSGHPVSGDLLANDAGTGLVIAGATGPSRGTLALDLDGRFTYTPRPGASGVEGFTYTLADDEGRTATAAVTITVLPAVHDDGPLTTPAGTLRHGDVLHNDAGTGLTATLRDPPSHGAVVLAPEGVFVYTPDAGFAGTDVFTYTATDAEGQAASARVTLVVTAAAAADTAIGTPGESVVLDALANDVPGADASWAGVVLLDPLTGEPADTVVVPEEGTWEVLADAQVRFTPVAGFVGTTTPVTYRATDTAGAAVSATLTATYPAPGAAGEPHPGNGTGAPGPTVGPAPPAAPAAPPAARLPDTGADPRLAGLAAALVAVGAAAVATGRRAGFSEGGRAPARTPPPPPACGHAPRACAGRQRRGSSPSPR